jgi:hypothetical protein
MADHPLFSLDPLLVWIPSAWLAVLLAHAGVSKLLDRPLFLQHLGAYRVPEYGQAALQHTLPLAELACAALLLSPWRAAGALMAAVLLCSYAAAMAVHLRAGRQLDCGCGGQPLPLSWALVARNMALLPLAALASLAPNSRAMTLADHAVTAAAVLLGALLWTAFHQLLRQQRPNTRIHPH